MFLNQPVRASIPPRQRRDREIKPAILQRWEAAAGETSRIRNDNQFAVATVARVADDMCPEPRARTVWMDGPDSRGARGECLPELPAAPLDDRRETVAVTEITPAVP